MPRARRPVPIRPRQAARGALCSLWRPPRRRVHGPRRAHPATESVRAVPPLQAGDGGMSGWVKIPEEWLGGPAIERLPAEGILFHFTALAHTARHSTNGQLDSMAVRKLWPVAEPAKVIGRLVAEGHWTPNA